MEYSSEIINHFLSDVFGDILKREEATLAAGDLSLREVQLIDAICRTVDEGATTAPPPLPPPGRCRRVP